MKGIILAGGSGTRLHPLTHVTSKQLLPVYDKPMIYYPLSVLMQVGIQEIAIISSPQDLPRFEELFKDGSSLGLTFTYIPQENPEGIAQALILAEEFIGNDSIALILGDNIFYGPKLETNHQAGATVFGYEVPNPSRYGVLDFDQNHKVKGIIEKPKDPPSNYAVTGLYFYDNRAPALAKTLKPSARGELEITDLNNLYLQKGELNVQLLQRGYAWLDTGTHEALHQASIYVHTIQERQGIQIACLEEIAYNMQFISLSQLEQLANKSPYLQNIIRKNLAITSKESQWQLN